MDFSEFLANSAIPKINIHQKSINILCIDSEDNVNNRMCNTLVQINILQLKHFLCKSFSLTYTTFYVLYFTIYTLQKNLRILFTELNRQVQTKPHFNYNGTLLITHLIFSTKIMVCKQCTSIVN